MSRSRLSGGFQIRVLSLLDLPEIFDIERRVYEDPWSEALLKESLSASMTYSLGVFKDGLCRAYCIYQVITSEAHLLNIAVHQDFQEKGLGGALLDAVIEDVKQRGGQRFFLEVRPSNLRARKLYEARAFQVIMTREAYYPDGESALVMLVDLSPSPSD